MQLQNNYSKVQYYCEEKNYIYIKTDDVEWITV